MSELLVRSIDWREWPKRAPEWERVLAASGCSSFFLSSLWIETWLSVYGEDLNPELVFFEDGGETAGCCLLVRRRQWVKGIPLRRIYLNCAGEDEADSTCIEYNALVARSSLQKQVAEALVGYLRRSKWDELLLDGIVEQEGLAALESSFDHVEASARPSYFVSLERLRREGKEFDSVLSSNTRQQIRRSMKLFEQSLGSPCTVAECATLEDALQFFGQLVELHQSSWRSRGQPGVFGSRKFRQFHETLIRSGFPAGRIQILRVGSGATPIGVLYNFVYDGRVYFYQSGTRQEKDNKLKPGMTTHYLAIRHCLAQEALKEYDFLAADSQYKRSLTNESRTLRWVIARRKTGPVRVFDWMRKGKRKVASLLDKKRRPSHEGS